MYLKNIIALCFLLVTALADTTKQDKQGAADKAQGPTADAAVGSPKPDASPESLKDADCSKFTAEALNKLTNMKACSVLTAGCLSKFDVKGLCAECLGNISITEWKKFEPQTVGQISNTSPDVLSLTPQQLEAVLPKLDLTKLSEGLAGYVVRTPQLLEFIFKTGNGKVLAAFITAKTLPSIPMHNFSRFSEKLIANLSEDAFQKATSEIIAVIPAEAFQGFYAKQWALVNPVALRALTRQQAVKLSKECWEATNIEQVKNFGQPVNKFNAMGLEKANILDRRQFKDQHPCNAFEGVRQGMDENKAKIFEERCKEVAAFKINSASTLKTSAATTGLILAAVAIPALLV